MQALEQLVNRKQQIEQLINDKKELLHLSLDAIITDNSAYYQYSGESRLDFANPNERANLEVLYLELERINAEIESFDNPNTTLN